MQSLYHWPLSMTWLFLFYLTEARTSCIMFNEEKLGRNWTDKIPTKSIDLFVGKSFGLIYIQCVLYTPRQTLRATSLIYFHWFFVARTTTGAMWNGLGSCASIWCARPQSWVPCMGPLRFSEVLPCTPKYHTLVGDEVPQGIKLASNSGGKIPERPYLAWQQCIRVATHSPNRVSDTFGELSTYWCIPPS